MKLNEHMSKKLLSRAGINVPSGELISRDQVDDFQPGFDLPWVVKAMVLSGGRGKAGGIKTVQGREEFREVAKSILDMSIKGESVPLLRVEPEQNMEREMYLSLLPGKTSQGFLLTMGRQGGVDIESMSQENILTLEIDPGLGVQDYQIRQGFFHLGLDKGLFPSWSTLIKNLYQATINNHLLLAEINPLVLTSGEELIALDGKVEIDDNYLLVNKDLENYYSPEHFSVQENTARQAGLSYHKLSGSVGLIVNGAGLAMATMDLLNFSGVPAANFLDLGGGADQERISRALNILFQDTGAETIFINIFGGILSCEKVASSLHQILEKEKPPKPMVVRFSGFRAREAGGIIESLREENVYSARDLNQALRILRELNPGPGEGPRFVRPEFPFVAGSGTPKSRWEPCPFSVNKNTRVLVQGITGREGMLHTREMLDYGTRVVAGVTPFKGGGEVEGIPVYDTVNRACLEHSIDASIIFVPAPLAADAILEAVACSIPWVVCITEGIPQQDMLRILPYIRKSFSRLIGPNTPGMIVPGQSKIGIMPGSIFSPGPVAVLSRSGTLTYECVQALSQAGIGQSLCLGIGGDPYVGMDFKDLAMDLQRDPRCRAVLVLGEIGGTAEEELGEKLSRIGFDKPVLGFVAGQTAPPGKRLGHAGAVLKEGEGGIRSKLSAMHQSGITICPDLHSIPDLMNRVLESG